MTDQRKDEMPEEIWAVKSGHWFFVNTPDCEPETKYIRAASTPSAEVQSKVDELRDNYSWIKKEKEVLEAEVMALRDALEHIKQITGMYENTNRIATEALNQTGGK